MTDTTGTPAPVADEITITLHKPVTFAGETHRSLILRDTTAGMWLGLDQFSGLESELQALYYLSGVHAPALKAMTARDFKAARKAMWTFLGAGERPREPDEVERTIVLREPVTVGEGCTELKLREPTAGDQIAWDGLEGVQKDLKAVQASTGLSEVVVRSVNIRDFRAAAGWVASFFEDAPATGALS